MKIKEFFKPSNFKNDPYGWLTNQISHVSLSYVLCYITQMPITIAILWLFWELNHLRISRDIIDFFEDMTYELGGVIIFLTVYPSLYIIIGLLIFNYYNKNNK